MTYQKNNKGSNFTLPVSKSTVLGGVKIGSGLNYGPDGTISVQSSANLMVSDLYIISGKVNAIGLAEINGRTGITILSAPNTVIEICFSSGTIKRFQIPSGSLTVPTNYSLRLNINTGELASVLSTDPYINQVLLLRVGSDPNGDMINQGKASTLIFGGCFTKYVYPNRVESEKYLTPKDPTKITFVGGSSIEGSTFINDQLWVCCSYKDGAGIIVKDPDTLTTLKTFNNSNYHFNSVDYNPINDCLLTGAFFDKNTANFHGFTIIHGATTFAVGVDVAGNTITKDVIDISSLGGEGPQPFWGENSTDIVYIVTDASVRIRQILLGRGNINLGSGVFTSGLSNDRYNGSFKVIGEWSQIHGSGRPQDGFFYNGCVYVNNDQGSTDSFLQEGMLMHKMELLSDGRIRKTKINIPDYDATGNLIISGYTSGGAAVRNGKIWSIYEGQPNMIYTFNIV